MTVLKSRFHMNPMVVDSIVVYCPLLILYTGLKFDNSGNRVVIVSSVMYNV